MAILSRSIIACLMALAFTAATAPAQVRSLPPVGDETPPGSSAVIQTTQVQPVSTTPNYPTDIFPPPSLDEYVNNNSLALQTSPAHPPVGHDGFIQQLAFQATYLPRFGGDDGQGITDLELSATGGLPFPTRDSPLLITPYFATHFLDGPTGVDLPPTLYDATVDFRWLRQWNPCWGTDLSVTPGLHTDFQTTDGEAFRIKAQAVAAYTWTPQAKLVFGVAFLDRNDVPWLPIGGLIWTPNDDTRWEILFPRPKFAQRIRWDGCVEDWWYIAGELGGDQWAIEQTGGVHNVVTTRDYRVMLGVERKVVGGLQSRAEIGYVFGRKIEFEDNTPDFDPTSTMLVRAGVAW